MRYPDFIRRRVGLKRLAATIRAEPFTIPLFHNVGRCRQADFLPPALDCDPEFFRATLRLLREEATVLSFHDLVMAIRENNLPPNPVAITFDDGFRDTLTVAWPLLKEFGMPAIVFPPTDAVGSTELLPVHKLYYNNLLNGSGVPASNTRERGEYIHKLLREREVTAPPLGHDLYLNWDDLRLLRSEGMEVGGHTCSHAWLGALPLEEQRREIVESKNLLEKELGCPVLYFAYPFGYYGASFSEATLEIVRQHYTAAAISLNDTGSVVDLHRLPRHGVNTFYRA
jgi:peptidoglycan/xylan/chitin deacetylase (PgdA/CDA1 family)